MVTDLEVNGFSIIFEVEQLHRPVGRVYIHEVKISRIIDRQTGRDVPNTTDVASISYGKSENEAYDKVAAQARKWAEDQPTQRS
jgi:hypothetical protein